MLLLVDGRGAFRETANLFLYDVALWRVNATLTEKTTTSRLQHSQPISPTVEASMREIISVAVRAMLSLRRASAVAAATAASAKYTF